jgi:hypothetical protein
MWYQTVQLLLQIVVVVVSAAKYAVWAVLHKKQCDLVARDALLTIHQAVYQNAV